MIGTASLMVSGGCAIEVPYAPRPDAKPVPVYCFDSVGHMPGAKPFVLGGTCCCTPSEAVVGDYKQHGHVPQDMTLQQLIALYERDGIKTALDHYGCNNLCKWGPHVIKGGKCMAPPTPGTYNFEEVRFNMRYTPVVKPETKR